VKILYGLPSEGMGHATRSRVIIAHLLEKHDVRIVTSDRAYNFMQMHFPGRVYKIQGFHLAYRNGSVSLGKSFAQILKKTPGDLLENFQKYLHIQKEFKAGLVVSDFESFAFFYAKYFKLPIISIDNMHVIDRCRFDIPIPKSEKDSYLIAKNIIKAKVPHCNDYLVTSFFDAEIRKENTKIIPPILRSEILGAGRKRLNHILVYQTSTSQRDIVPILNEMERETFYVYGFNVGATYGNVVMKPFSEAEFIKDLVEAKAVITNGGFTLISEAVYLNKPLCSMPINNQFEQYVNAAYIEKCGYGRRCSGFTPDAIKSFLYDLDKFQNTINGYQQSGNDSTFATLDKIISEYEA
jgi:uncharacterized protein (TIGR00661 family)